MDNRIGVSGATARSRLLTGSMILLLLGMGLWVRLIGEGLSFPDRAWAVLAWLAASIGISFLTRRLAGIEGALTALAISLFLPFAVRISREDVTTTLGIACLVWCLYALYRWIEAESWSWALAASLLGCLAGAARGYFLFPAAIGLLGLALTSEKTRIQWKNGQAWAILAGMLLLPFGLALVGVAHPMEGLAYRWTPQVLQPWWIVRWLNLLRSQVDLNLILLSLLGLLLLPAGGRWMLIGAWLGYVLAGLSLSQDLLIYPSIHLMVVPLAAVSLAQASQAVFGRISSQSRGWQIAFSLLLALSLAYAIYIVNA